MVAGNGGEPARGPRAPPCRSAPGPAGGMGPDVTPSAGVATRQAAKAALADQVSPSSRPAVMTRAAVVRYGVSPQPHGREARAAARHRSGHQPDFPRPSPAGCDVSHTPVRHRGPYPGHQAGSRRSGARRPHTPETDTMRRRLCLLLALAATLAAHRTRAAEDLALGFANPLSGPYATSGNDNRTAVELAVEDLDRAGGLLGRRVRVVVADDACGVERAEAAARELVGAGVVAVVGHFCSHASL